jgi:hypothetical protein
MKNLFSQNPKLTKETRIIVLSMGLLMLFRVFLGILGKDLNQFVFYSLVGVLIGMLYMHLYDIRKFKRDE